MALLVFKKISRVTIYEQHKLPHNVFNIEYYDGTHGRMTEEDFDRLKLQHTKQVNDDKVKANKIYAEDLERTERAMESGMGLGIDAYNDMNGDS
jgi:hypothetical protein|tara:strand:- start:685 stop:966 length:282 start_codon:yes stop_codon:yes gene_type:complete